jgi:hypothetical protein
MRPAIRFSRSLGLVSTLATLTLGPVVFLSPNAALAQSPVVTAPPTARSHPGCTLTFTVTATAIPGETIASLTATGAPIDLLGATFTPNATNTEGTFSWQIPITGGGSFTVTFRAVDSAGLLGSASTTIVVALSDAAPVVVAPASVTGMEGQQFCFTVSAVDPDGDPPVLQPPGPIPLGATFVIGPPDRGTFCWTPDSNDAGSYSVTLCAVSSSCTGAQLTGCATIAITIFNANLPPTLAAIGDLAVEAGASLDKPLSASDPDGDALAFSKTAGPFFVTVSTTGPTTGNLNAGPGLADAGTHSVTVNVSDGFANDSETLTLTVTPCDCPPVADAGGPYQGFVGVPIQFDGTSSSDPLGSPLAYAWDFGDGESATGPQPAHAYLAEGTYQVLLTVTNNRGQSDADAITVIIGGPPPAIAFTTGGNGAVRLASSKPRNCVRIEPFAGAFQVEDVDLASVVMVSAGTGSVGQIPAIAGKTSVASDANQNGVLEIEACFSKENLRQLFSNLPSGSNNVTVSIEGNLSFGARFAAQLDLVVFGTGGALSSSFRFDPQTSQGVLTFVTNRAGSARVHFFDARGRLVRTVLDTSNLSAGAHDVRVEAQSGGARLAAGIYFYRVVTPEGTAEGRALLLR